MGYRSDVMAVIYPDAYANDEELRIKYDQLKTLMGTTFKDVEDKFSADMEWLDRDCVLRFNIKDVKWYPGNTYVQKFTEMMTALGNEDPDDGGVPGYCTEFVRIGEDNNDVDEDRNGENLHYYLSVRRSIECDL